MTLRIISHGSASRFAASRFAPPGVLQLFELPSGSLVFSSPALRNVPLHPATAPHETATYIALRARGTAAPPRVRIIELRLVELFAIFFEGLAPLEALTDITRDDMQFLFS